MGEERFNRFMEAFNEEAPTSIRLNDLKMRNEKLEMRNDDYSFNQIPWCEEGYYLEGRPQFTFDPLFHAGCYYVQEAASMFITHVLRSLGNHNSSFLIPHSSLSVLDLCAAPGGKSTAMRSVLPED